MENLKELMISFISVILVILKNICLIILLSFTARKNRKPKHLVHLLPQVITFIVQFKGLRSWLLSALNASMWATTYNKMKMKGYKNVVIYRINSTRVENLSLSMMWKSPISGRKPSDLTGCHENKQMLI